MTSDIRRLAAADIPAFQVLRRRALAERPDVFSASPETDRALSPDFVVHALRDEQHQALFGAFAEGSLGGCVGLMRPVAAKTSHVATLWGMYVGPELRRQGAGQALVEAAIARARSWQGVVQIGLCVSESAPDACRLYERAGFSCWGREPQALRVDDRLLDEDHLVLRLS